MPGTSTEQVVDKGIRQKSIHSFHSIHSFTDGSAFCPGHRSVFPLDSEKHRRVYTSSNVCLSHEWRVDTASGKTLKKMECVFTRCPTGGRKKKCVYIYGLRSEGVKANVLKGQYRHDQSRLSTGHGIKVLVQDEHRDGKLLAHLCSSNGNMTLSCGVLFSVTELI